MPEAPWKVLVHLKVVRLQNSHYTHAQCMSGSSMGSRSWVHVCLRLIMMAEVLRKYLAIVSSHVLLVSSPSTLSGEPLPAADVSWPSLCRHFAEPQLLFQASLLLKRAARPPQSPALQCPLSCIPFQHDASAAEINACRCCSPWPIACGPCVSPPRTHSLHGACVCSSAGIYKSGGTK